jgi:molybdopterin-containing oxidoreductase family membrane subunit
MAVVGAYLFVMMDRRVGRSKLPTKAVGTFAFVWRLILTTGTGSIFGFLIAREAYSAAIMAPLFIAASFLYGLAFMILVLMTTGREMKEDLLSAEMTKKFGGLLILFALATLYFVTVHHLTKIYAAGYRDVEDFLLLSGGIYTTVFWVGQIVIGLLLPLAILVFVGRGRGCVVAASLLFLIGGIAHMYVTIIAAQAYPLNLFPGMEVTSSFGDGSVAIYTPSLPEVLLGVSGIAIAVLLVGIAVKVLPFLPRPARA